MSVLAMKRMYAQELRNLSLQSKLVTENNNIWNGIDSTSVINPAPTSTPSAQDQFYNQATMESEMGSIDTSRRVGESIADYLGRMDIAQNGIQSVSDQKALVNQRVINELKNKINMLTKNAVVTEMIINSNDFTDGEKIHINTNWDTFAKTVVTSPPVTVTYFNYQVDQFFYGKNYRPEPEYIAGTPYIKKQGRPPKAGGTPYTPIKGTPIKGTPTSGTSSGFFGNLFNTPAPAPAPATGTPATGTPATGTPATGTPAPATGTPAPATGTPAVVPPAVSLTPMRNGVYVTQSQNSYQMALSISPDKFVLVRDKNLDEHIMFMHGTQIVESYRDHYRPIKWNEVSSLFTNFKKLANLKDYIVSRLSTNPDLKIDHYSP